MQKIEKLTAAQEREMVAYLDEWLAIGRSTEPADRPTAEKAISEMYRLMKWERPYFWWCDGPAVGSMVRTIISNGRDNLEDNLEDNLRDNLEDNLRDNLGDNLEDNLRDNLRANLRDNLWDNLGDNLRANLGANLGDNLGANLRGNLRDNLRDNLGDNLGDNLRANLGDNLGDNLRANLRANLRDNLWDNLGDNLRANLNWGFWGQHESAWPAYYQWPDMALRKMFSDENREKLNLWVSLSKSCGWWNPFKAVVFVCERPSVQAVDSRGLLHKDQAPALLCRDGWPVYCLHGVRMKKEYVLTPAEKIEPETVLAEQNADVRRELIRKVGIERMLSKIPHKSMEKRGKYELLSIRLSDEVTDARYLRMENPSLGTFHLEGVEPSCKTITESLNWRNSNWHENAEILT